MTIATATRTAKGYALTFNDGRVANVGAAFTHVALYSTGGWNGHAYKATGVSVSDLPCHSKHKSEAAALKAARDHVAYSGGTYELVDLTAL